jgi:Tn3 transposase DDE domain
MASSTCSYPHVLTHICFEAAPAGRPGQEDQLGALGLVVNMIVLWNTIYMEAVLEQFRKEGYPVNEEDKARLSPLIHEHINTQGRHSFVMPEAVVKGELRPLRNPADDLD